MKIVILDGHVLNPGHLSWNAFRELGEVEVFDRTSENDIANRARDADLVLTTRTPLSAATIAQLTHLRYLGVVFSGYDQVNLKAARDRRVVVTNPSTFGSASVVELLFALLLELCHHLLFQPALDCSSVAPGVDDSQISVPREIVASVLVGLWLRWFRALRSQKKMISAVIGLLLGLVVGAGCRFFDIPSPAPPRLIGAGMLLAMTLGFVTAEHVLPPQNVAVTHVMQQGNTLAQLEAAP